MIATKVFNRLAVASTDVRGIQATLRALSPQGTLERGFSIVRNTSGKIVKSITEISSGEKLRIRLSDGELEVNAD